MGIKNEDSELLEVVTFDEIEAADDEYEICIAGINYRNLKATDIGYGKNFKIVSDPDNKHDDSAVKIYKGRKFVGYIPSDDNGEWFDLLEDMDEPIKCRGFVGTFMDEDGVVKFYGCIYLKDSLLEDNEILTEPIIAQPNTVVEKKKKSGCVVMIQLLLLLVVAFVFIANIFGDNHDELLTEKMDYLSGIVNIEWWEVDDNTIYIGFAPETLNFEAVCNSAALLGNKTIDFGCHVFAIDASKYQSYGDVNGDWRYMYTVTYRDGKME